MDREHLNATLPICRSRRCGHYQPNADAEWGCDLIDGCRCNLIKHLLAGGGCVADPPLFEPVDDQ